MKPCLKKRETRNTGRHGFCRKERLKRYAGALTFIMLFSVFAGNFSVAACFAEEIRREARFEDLESKSEAYFKENRYGELIDLLNDLKDDSTAEKNAYIDYYLAAAKMEHLIFLYAREDWKRYYDLKGDYFSFIFRTTSRLAEDNPGSKFAADNLFLKWRARRQEEDLDEGEAAFDEFISALLNYAAQAKDPGIFKEYAFKLKARNEKKFSAKLYNLYVNRSLEHKDYKPVFEIAREYREERDFERERFVLREALKTGPPVDTACRMLKIIADSYLDSRNREKSYLTYKEIVDDYPYNRFSKVGFNRALNLFYQYQADRKPHIFVPREKEKEYEDYLKKIAVKYAGTRLEPWAKYLLADHWMKTGRGAEAGDLFKKILQNHPDCRDAPAAKRKLNRLEEKGVVIKGNEKK